MIFFYIDECNIENSWITLLNNYKQSIINSNLILFLLRALVKVSGFKIHLYYSMIFITIRNILYLFYIFLLFLTYTYN